MGAPFGLVIRTEAIEALRRSLGIELVAFQAEQKHNMRRAVNLIRKYARREWSEAVFLHSRRIVTGMQTSVKHVRGGLWEGRVYWGKSAYYGKFHELGAKPHSLAPATSKKKARNAGRNTRWGMHPGVPALDVNAQVVEQHVDEVREILGDSYNVFLGRFEGRVSRAASFAGELSEAA